MRKATGIRGGGRKRLLLCVRLPLDHPGRGGRASVKRGWASGEGPAPDEQEEGASNQSGDQEGGLLVERKDGGEVLHRQELQVRDWTRLGEGPGDLTSKGEGPC